FRRSRSGRGAAPVSLPAAAATRALLRLGLDGLRDDHAAALLSELLRQEPDLRRRGDARALHEILDGDDVVAPVGPLAAFARVLRRMADGEPLDGEEPMLREHVADDPPRLVLHFARALRRDVAGHADRHGHLLRAVGMHAEHRLLAELA